MVITALVLAAGLSRRMAAPKLLLPWRGHTVIEHVVDTLAASGLADILVVTGHRGGEVAEVLARTPARTVFNLRYAEGEMLSSIQTGLAALGEDNRGVQAALLCLGDQPQMQAEAVRAVLAAGVLTDWQRVIIPSYQMRAGHPILLPRAIWPAILASQEHLRAVLMANRTNIDYVTVQTPTILADLDTPEDYQREQVEHGN